MGAILSATDPVAVVALLEKAPVSHVLGTIIEGESLFNDGTAMVFFFIFYEFCRNRTMGTVEIIYTFCRLVFLGFVVGWVVWVDLVSAVEGSGGAVVEVCVVAGEGAEG